MTKQKKRFLTHHKYATLSSLGAPRVTWAIDSGTRDGCFHARVSPEKSPRITASIGTFVRRTYSNCRCEIRFFSVPKRFAFLSFCLISFRVFHFSTSFLPFASVRSRNKAFRKEGHCYATCVFH